LATLDGEDRGMRRDVRIARLDGCTARRACRERRHALTGRENVA
jgi:hypothetical protein